MLYADFLVADLKRRQEGAPQLVAKLIGQACRRATLSRDAARLPVFLYDVPSRTACGLADETAPGSPACSLAGIKGT